MGVGIGRDAAGGLRTVIGTSEANGYLRPAVRAAIQAGEEVAPGLGHAEQDILSYMLENGMSPLTVGAGRPICPICAGEISGAGCVGGDAAEVMSRSGIGLVDEGLAGVLARSSSEACRRGLAAGIHLALERTGVSDQRLDRAVEALSAGQLGDGVERSAVSALVDELDEAAWDLQDRVEAGIADQSDYLRAFAQARAAAAVGFAFDRDARVASSEGLYEAFHAVGDASSLRRVVLEALDEGGDSA